MVALRVLALILLLAGVLLFAIHQSWLPIADRWNPWAPLDIQDKPNFLLGWKLSRLSGDPAACLQTLATGSLDFTPLPDRVPEPQCPLQDVVRVSDSDVAFNRSFIATCPLAVAWSLYEIHGLQAAADKHLNGRVVGVEHLGSYACRSISGSDRMSQHARANALDIAAFEIEDGRRIELLSDWEGEGEEGAFLKAARDAACDYFGATLGPDYNSAHANHFHLDMGSYFTGICR